MSSRSHPDVPGLPFDKPKQIEALEQMNRAMLDLMPPLEVDETVAEIAHAVATTYKQKVKNSDYDGCVEVVAVALSVTGSSIGGHVGNAMVAANQHMAVIACRRAFPQDE